MSERVGGSSSPIVCFVTDRKSLCVEPSRCDLLDVIRNAVRAGVDWIQIRDKDLTGRDAYKLVREAVSISKESPASRRARIIVNDRLDVALASGAAGVHLGSQSLPVSRVVEWRGAGNALKDFLIGASCHSLDDAVAAEQEGADYVFFGPIFATPSKASFGAPQGLDRLATVCSRVKIAVLAIGGVNAENAIDCLRAGAAGIAAIRLFQNAASDHQIIEQLGRLRGVRG